MFKEIYLKKTIIIFNREQRASLQQVMGTQYVLYSHFR